MRGLRRLIRGSRRRRRPGAAGLVLVDGVPLLHPEPQVFEAMLEGWRNQMLARNLAVSTITSRAQQVRAFAEHAEHVPVEWSLAAGR